MEKRKVNKEYEEPELEIIVLDGKDCIVMSGNSTDPEVKDDI